MTDKFFVTPTINENFKLTSVQICTGNYDGTLYVDPEHLDELVNKLAKIRDRYKAVKRALESLDETSMVF